MEESKGSITKTIGQVLASGDLLVADGAAGTMLMAAGLAPGMPPDLWNLEQPQAIVNLHSAYIEAGSTIILTNTFGANRVKLEKTGMSDRVEKINRAGVELARQASAGRAFVAGDIGPTGELMAPIGSLTMEAAYEAFSEQAAALARAGVDAIWIETMADLQEAQAAVTAARKESDLPVFCSLSFGRKARTMMGVSAKQAAETLWPLGLSAMGANCGERLEVVDLVLEQMHALYPEAPLIAKPNAGLPRMVDGQMFYDVDAAQFAQTMQQFVERGARIVGACCGSNPEYITAICNALRLKRYSFDGQ